MNYFKKINLFGGWGVFLISALVYTLTMEPTASLWDCSEFIATSYKLEVGHPPGAPLFMMVNRLFSMFAPDTSSVAAMVNFASAIASALTIAFLFWTIAHLGVRLLNKEREDLNKNEIWLVNIAAFIGSMAYAFTDTFWFSAVEGEVYAQSSLFTALVYWAMLKWENEADKPHATRWIILVAYLIGLSIGVHLLNLLAIPALVLVFYYRKVQNKSKLGWWKAFGLSVLILAFILFGVIPMIPQIGAWFDRVAVNSLGMPVNSGFFAFFILLIAALAYGVYYTHIRGRSIMNTFLLCLTVIILGFSSYASVVIRAMANPPMNSNSPSDPYSLLSLLNRDQYGSAPLIYGNYYSSPVVDYKEKTTYYYDNVKKEYVPYETIDIKSLEYAPGTTSFFPRMYSDDKNHIEGYKLWAGDIKGKNVRLPDGEMVNIPTFAENLRYFFNYQVRYMYWRYFLWNFVGRQDDIQGDGSVLHGNWMSGIKFIDEMYLGNLDNLPDDLKENRGRNTYFFLPFLLGLAGIFYQLRRDKNNFNVVMFLFLMTGLAIILYLNQSPNQPRERDYAYAGSFYAFSIWIGLGVFWVYSMLHKLKMSEYAKTATTTVVCLSVPVILLAQNWDDHSRAGRYIARDMGSNYLETTLPNSIILPYGDNDTFPLWYNQEVEGVRRDVKISNLSYLSSDWYTEQMTQRTYEAAPIDFTIPKRVYYKNNEQIFIYDLMEGYVSGKDALNFIKDNSEAKRSIMSRFDGRFPEILISHKIFIPVNKENVLKSGIVKPEDAHLIVDTIFLDIKVNSLNRSEYMLLDMIVTSDWNRPIYFTQPTMSLSKLGLEKYIQQDGIAYRLVPIATEGEYPDYGRIDVDYLYDNLMKFKYGNIKNPDVNVDYFVRYTLTASNIRHTFARLARELVEKGDTTRAVNVINKAMEEIPHYQLPYDMGSIRILEAMYMAGMTEQADQLMDEIIDYNLSYMEYFSGFDNTYFGQLRRDIHQALFALHNVYVVGMSHDREEKVSGLKEYSDMVK